MSRQWFGELRSWSELGSWSGRERYGFIETSGGDLLRIQFRPWPKLISVSEALWFGRWRHETGRGDRCRLYFNQPIRHGNYLNLAYVESSAASSFRNLYLAMQILDLVGWRKRSDAILCEVTNSRISDRLMRRWGWEQHLLNSGRRHWIKRFYGDYSRVALLNSELVATRGRHAVAEVADN